MDGILASAVWLTGRRIRIVAALTLAISLGLLIWLFATATGTLDIYGRPLGTDFSNVWSAGWMSNHGQAGEIWHWPAQRAAQIRLHGAVDVPFYPWPYPPPFLLIASPLAHLPYLAALLLWQAMTLVPALLILRRIVPGRTALLVALACPAVFICLGHGQNGFLTAALLAGGLLLLERRPLLAGLLLGCLCYKPQFALVLPFFLIAARNGRAFLGAALSSAGLCALTLALWGWPVWQSFFDSLPATRTIIVEQGGAGWDKIVSPFGAVRLWGGPVALAYAAQLLVGLPAIGAALLLARRGNIALRNAALLAATLLSTPYLLDYDLVVLGMAMAFLFSDMSRRGLLPWEGTLLAACWAVPLAGRACASLLLLPADLIAVLIVMLLIVRRSRYAPVPVQSGSLPSTTA